MAIQPVVEIQNDIYSFEPANNGAGPLCCGVMDQQLLSGRLMQFM